MSRVPIILDELSVRKQPRGGDVYRGMYFRGRRERLTEGRIVILVHGFNVDMASARGTYEEFLGRLETQVWPAPLKRYGAFFGFYWPGDHRFQPASVATFPVRIAVAREAARQLATLIRRRFRPDQEVFFVAHSLGCRVVLETLYEIAVLEADGAVNLAPVRGVFLMAGAVPYQRCEGDDIFHRRDPERPRDWVIHSTKDKVLRAAFPGGEWLYSEPGGEAVGRHGWPAGRWHCSVRTKLDHGEYWETWPGVLENVPVMLGDALPLQLPEWPDNFNAGALPGNELPARALAKRRIGSPLESGWEVLLPQI